ncbi:MAG: pyridoxal phosphate-dependent aminotransferase, partial [Phycisphaerales bacterium]
IGRFPEASNRTITISGASKTYAVTGWRIGYAVGPSEVIDKIAVVNDLLYICAPAPLQHGVRAGLRLPNDYYAEMRADYRVKRDLLARTLREIGLVPFIPQGSYYMLASFEPGRWADATAAAEALLQRVGVAVVPGTAFYRNPQDGLNHLRFCYAKQTTDLQDACTRLRRLGAARTAAVRTS